MVSCLDIIELREIIAKHGPVIRIVIADHQGSSPRETGTSMLVTNDNQHGTIGGGALEHQAIQSAREMLVDKVAQRFAKTPLGPSLGQCCGGTVSLLWERFEAVEITGDIYTRPINDSDIEMPLSVRAKTRDMRSGKIANLPTLLDGWFVEPISQPRQAIWIYGAGHVGRALVTVLADLPFDITWIDSDRERFPTQTSATILVAKNPADAVKHAPDNARHIVLTYSHAFDLEICQQVLTRPFASLGLIGSSTKNARFRKRLRESGVDPTRLECPIGDPSLGKEPMAIAIGVASTLLKTQDILTSKKVQA